MTKKYIDAVLWRRYATSTSDCLWGSRLNQYYIELRPDDYARFFGNSARQAKDQDGNETYSITLEAFDGVPQVASTDITFTLLRAGLQRARKWRINGQHKDQAYALWRRRHGPQKEFAEMDPVEKATNLLVIVRDVGGCFHGRWIRSEDFEKLPLLFQTIFREKSSGWREL